MVSHYCSAYVIFGFKRSSRISSNYAISREWTPDTDTRLEALGLICPKPGCPVLIFCSLVMIGWARDTQ
eukprot:scaffold68749_cov111-Cyclotella_meneghiniana.AAC.2